MKDWLYAAAFTIVVILLGFARDAAREARRWLDEAMEGPEVE